MLYTTCTYTCTCSYTELAYRKRMNDTVVKVCWRPSFDGNFMIVHYTITTAWLLVRHWSCVKSACDGLHVLLLFFYFFFSHLNKFMYLSILVPRIYVFLDSIVYTECTYVVEHKDGVYCIIILTRQQKHTFDRTEHPSSSKKKKKKKENVMVPRKIHSMTPLNSFLWGIFAVKKGSMLTWI